MRKFSIFAVAKTAFLRTCKIEAYKPSVCSQESKIPMAYKHNVFVPQKFFEFLENTKYFLTPKKNKRFFLRILRDFNFKKIVDFLTYKNKILNVKEVK